MDHSIEDGTAPKRLSTCFSPATCLQLVADEVLIAIDLRFRQRTSVIATGCFHALRPWCRMARRISSLANAGALQLPCCWIFVFAQRDEGPNRGITPRRGQGVENLLFVIRTIPAYRPHRLVDLGQQRGDLRGIIDPMGPQRLGDHLTVVASWTPTCSKAPSPPFGPAVPFHSPSP